MIVTPKIVSRFGAFRPWAWANGYFHPSSIYFPLRLDIYLCKPPSHVDICVFIFISFLRKHNSPVRSANMCEKRTCETRLEDQNVTGRCVFLQPSPIAWKSSENIEINLKIACIVSRVEVWKNNFVYQLQWCYLEIKKKISPNQTKI